MSHTIYKVYNAQGLIYVGRTNQPLTSRLRGHFFDKPFHSKLDITDVTKIVYAELPTTADMYVYEIYYINRDKPLLNRSDKANDALTVELPDLQWTPYEWRLKSKWEKAISETRMRRLLLDSNQA